MYGYITVISYQTLPRNITTNFHNKGGKVGLHSPSPRPSKSLYLNQNALALSFTTNVLVLSLCGFVCL